MADGAIPRRSSPLRVPGANQVRSIDLRKCRRLLRPVAGIDRRTRVRQGHAVDKGGGGRRLSGLTYVPLADAIAPRCDTEVILKAYAAWGPRGGATQFGIDYPGRLRCSIRSRCCARTASGHAEALTSPAMKSLRRMLDVPPRWLRRPPKPWSALISAMRRCGSPQFSWSTRSGRHRRLTHFPRLCV